MALECLDTAPFRDSRRLIGSTEKFLELALKIGSEDVYMWYDRSLTLLALNRPDDAIASVEELVARGYSTDLLASDVMYTDIVDDPRFNAIIKATK